MPSEVERSPWRRKRHGWLNYADFNSLTSATNYWPALGKGLSPGGFDD